MRRPGWIAKVQAKIETDRAAMRGPVNPGDTAPADWTEVRLRDLGAGVIRPSRKDCDEWCSNPDNCRGSWTVRMDRGRMDQERLDAGGSDDLMVPVYAFSDGNEAFAFKFRFG